MAKILKPKVQASGLMDNFELGVLKVVSERALTPVVGNSTLTSGGVKVVLGGVVPSLSGNKHAGLLSSALIVDGVEDLVHTLVGGMLNSGDSNGGW